MSLYTKYSIVNNDWHLNTDRNVDVITVGELIKGLYIPNIPMINARVTYGSIS